MQKKKLHLLRNARVELCVCGLQLLDGATVCVTHVIWQLFLYVSICVNVKYAHMNVCMYEYMYLCV